MALSSFKRIMKIYTFPKSEHLCSQKDIEALFTAGSRSSVMYPLRAVWRLVDYDKGPKVQVLLSVSKRRLRHAVDRNRAKRQLREAYRLQKHTLIDVLPENVGLHVAFLWLSDGNVDTNVVYARVGALLQKITERTQLEIKKNLSSDHDLSDE